MNVGGKKQPLAPVWPGRQQPLNQSHCSTGGLSCLSATGLGQVLRVSLQHTRGTVAARMRASPNEGAASQNANCIFAGLYCAGLQRNKVASCSHLLEGQVKLGHILPFSLQF